MARCTSSERIPMILEISSTIMQMNNGLACVAPITCMMKESRVIERIEIIASWKLVRIMPSHVILMESITIGKLTPNVFLKISIVPSSP